MKHEVMSMKRTITKAVELQYLLFLPEGYGDDPKALWPMILFLHGAGERGSDVEAVRNQGLPGLLDEIDYFPFVLVCPQCPDGYWWGDKLDDLNALIDDTIENFTIDEKRIYLTGLSMGGYGTWHLASAYPERFAAIAPVCGGGIPEEAYILKDIPVWVFHGADDDIVPPEESQVMVDALRKCGGNVMFTLYPNTNHNSWTQTYKNPELYRWLLQQSR